MYITRMYQEEKKELRLSSTDGNHTSALLSDHTYKMSLPLNTDTVNYSTTRVEIFDHDVMLSVLRHDGLSYELRKGLKAYYKNRFDGNKFRATYTYAKKYRKHQVGRLYVTNNLGIQVFEHNVRNALLQQYYWDVDIKNAHSVFLSQLCEKYGWASPKLNHYVENREAVIQEVIKFYDSFNLKREDVKNLFIRILYLGRKENWMDDQFIKRSISCDYVTDYQKEIDAISINLWNHPDFKLYRTCVLNIETLRKSDPNFKPREERIKNPDTHLRASFMSLVLQDIEKKVLMSAMSYLEREQREMAVLMYDGGAVRKLPNEREFPEELLKGMREYGHKATGYCVDWVVKPMTHNLDLSKKIDNLIDSSIDIDDDFAARCFYDIIKGQAISSGKSIYVFDERTGLWNDDKRGLERLVSVNMHKLTWCQYNEDAKLIKTNYGGSTRKTADMLRKVEPLLPECDDFIEKNIETSLGKLLFRNGIYDFETDTFTKGFNPNIVFAYRIDRDFERSTPEEIEAVRKVLFVDPFDAETMEDAEYLAKGIARALTGDFEARLMYICRGSTASSKGTLAGALQEAFGDYIGNFNANSITYKKFVTDEAKFLSWLVTIRNKRLCISSEISMNQSVDGTFLKRIVSGGDRMTARQNFKDETSIVNRATFMMMCNDVPKFEPVDDALMSRLRVVDMPNSFVAEPNPDIPSEKQADPEIKKLFKNDKVRNAVVALFIEYFQKFQKEGMKEPARVMKETEEWVAQDESWTDIFERYFIATTNESDELDVDYVFGQFEKHMKGISKVKIGKLLKSLGINRKRVRRGSARIYVYTNIKDADDSVDGLVI
jgi:hypothetical protein